jgi:hypothetical protein
VGIGGSLSITLTATDSDAGDTLTFEVLSGPSFGMLTGTPPDLTYVPNAAYRGNDNFNFTATDPNTGIVLPKTVYSPGDITITEIRSSENVTAGASDYSIIFSPCRQVQGYLNHVQQLHTDVLAALDPNEAVCYSYDTGGETYRSCTHEVAINLTGGVPIGSVGNTDKVFALDLGTFDARIQSHVYANPSRFYTRIDHFDQFHLVCALDYFTQSVKDALTQHLGDHGGSYQRTETPVCGEVAQDVAGTLKGIWFSGGTTETYPEDPHLALARENTLGIEQGFSIGTTLPRIDGSNEVLYFMPASSGQTNRDFSQVTADGNVYCYDSLQDRWGASINAVMLAQLTSATTLRIEQQNAASCAAVGPWTFGANARDFER